MQLPSPKQQFLDQEQLAREWREIVIKPAFLAAITYARAEYASTSPTQEALTGVNNFIQNYLLEVGEKPSTPSRLPIKTVMAPELLTPENKKKG